MEKGWLPVQTLMNKYQEICYIFSLKHLLTCPARGTCNTSSLIDHTFTNSTGKIFQPVIIDCVILNHKLIFSTR